ncbi:MAG: AI-2E family transporter [Nitrospirae bacterium]|nr:MAG: AI-2E family transporter [Nitrospirota bacterium]
MRQAQPGKSHIITLTVITALLAYLSFLIIKPFLTAIAWAVVLTVVFYPVHLYGLRYIKYPSLSSALVIVLVVFLTIGPFSYILLSLAAEVKHVISLVNNQGFKSLNEILTHERFLWLQDQIRQTLNLPTFDLKGFVLSAISKGARTLLENLTHGVANVLTIGVNFAMMLFAMFFMLRDGERFASELWHFLPFSEPQKKRLACQMRDMVISTIYGGVVVALLQGLVGGITFTLLGLKSPVLLGTAMAFASFIPGIGAFGVWGPVVVYLFIKKLYLKAVIMLLIGALVISMIDNFLKPIIISGRTRMPTVVIFFSVIGGINLFGFVGLVLGPLVLALFVTVFEIFRNLDIEHSTERGEL